MPNRTWGSALLEELRTWVTPVVTALAFTTFGASAVSVDGVSMTPNLRHGERLLIPKYETWLHRAGIRDFRRGDILVFKPPADPSVQRRRALGVLWEYTPFLVKRVIGVPGDTVRIDRGRVWVNEQPLDPSFALAYWQAQGCWDQTSLIANHARVRIATESESGAAVLAERAVTVPAGHYFVMGDNRTAEGSTDSRSFGLVPLRNVAGRASAVFWPLTRKADSTYDCAAHEVTPAGETKANVRVLRAFEKE